MQYYVGTNPTELEIKESNMALGNLLGGSIPEPNLDINKHFLLYNDKNYIESMHCVGKSMQNGSYLDACQQLSDLYTELNNLSLNGSRNIVGLGIVILRAKLWESACCYDKLRDDIVLATREYPTLLKAGPLVEDELAHLFESLFKIHATLARRYVLWGMRKAHYVLRNSTNNDGVECNISDSTVAITGDEIQTQYYDSDVWLQNHSLKDIGSEKDSENRWQNDKDPCSVTELTDQSFASNLVPTMSYITEDSVSTLSIGSIDGQTEDETYQATGCLSKVALPISSDQSQLQQCQYEPLSQNKLLHRPQRDQSYPYHPIDNMKSASQANSNVCVNSYQKCQCGNGCGGCESYQDDLLSRNYLLTKPPQIWPLPYISIYIPVHMDTSNYSANMKARMISFMT
jgi:hypothetical protein